MDARLRWAGVHNYTKCIIYLIENSEWSSTARVTDSFKNTCPGGGGSWYSKTKVRRFRVAQVYERI